MTAIALVIGVYLIATTVMISKDGVLYIESAQKLESEPIEIIKKQYPGYPFLILMAHKSVTFFTKSSSVFTWIYAAQGVTLLCRLLALIPLYFTGKLLVGGKNSFWGLLILILLPHPAHFACDVVREWPYILFLAVGFCFLIWGAKYGKWWTFAVAGLGSGLAYLIRPEGVQLVVYGCLWVLICAFRPVLWNVSRWKNIFALVLLLGGFVIPAMPYIKHADRVIPKPLERIIKSFSMADASPANSTDIQPEFAFGADYNTAGIISGDVFKAVYRLFQQISENLMHFFLLPLIVGIFVSMRRFRKALCAETFFVFCLIVLYTAMMIMLYINHGYISRRHCLPMVVFTVFYIPVGLNVIGGWFAGRGGGCRQEDKIEKDRRRWFIILFLIGSGICVLKLFKPVRLEKKGRLEVVNWLKENTGTEDVVAVPDARWYFYAERKGVVYTRQVPSKADYMLEIVRNEDDLIAGRSFGQAKARFSIPGDAKTHYLLYDVKNYNCP